MLNYQCAELQQYSQVQNTDMLFKKANEICGKTVTKLPPVKIKDEKTLENTEEIHGRWKEHFEELYNIQNLVDQNIFKEQHNMSDGEEFDNFIEQEIKASIKGLKERKASGADKHHCRNVTRWRRAYSENDAPALQQEEHVPIDWGKAIIVPLYKKSDERDCGNYRGISLLSIPGKVFTKVLQQRLMRYVESCLTEEQAGFRPGKAPRISSL